jgi:hypothetical protein
LNIALLVAGAGLLLGLVALPVTLANLRRAHRERGENQFTKVREHIRVHQPELYSLAQADMRNAWRKGDIPMITKPEWIPASPQPLSSVKLAWDDKPLEADHLDASLKQAAKLMPRRPSGSTVPTYSETLSELGGMSHLYNGWIYRPVRIGTNEHGLELTFASGRYFDHLNTTEVLAYEAGAAHLAHEQSVMNGHYRRFLSDPFDLLQRATSLGVITLTVRVDSTGSGFYMHKRDSRQVIVGPEVIHAVPAGEFTPADIGLDSRQSDFNLWRTVMREYVEEFLDIEEAYGRGGRPLDYENDEPFNKLFEGYRTGTVRPSVLGIGLDPLTWKPEILLTCAIDAPVFDDIFAEIVTQGKEGTIIVGPHGHGIPFNEEAVRRYADSPTTRSAARACLTLAWRHRAELGLDPHSPSEYP